MGSRVRVLVLLCLSCFLIPAYSAADTLGQGKQLGYGELLTSSNGRFRLGFFRFSRYADKSFLGIWYNDQSYQGSYPDVVQQPVWVANRNTPISNGSGILSVKHNGCLQILSGGREITALYSASASIQARAALHNNGNFVLHLLNSDGSVKGDLWQSFDHPTNTLLPGMKLGFNLKTGLTWNLTSKRSFDSPAAGSFTLGIDPKDGEQLVIWRREDAYWRSGPWQRSNSDFSNFALQDFGYSFSFTQNENETYFNYTANQELVLFPAIGIDSDDGVMISVGGFLLSRSFSCSSGYFSFRGPLSGCIKQKLPECRGSIPDDGISPEYGSMSSPGFRFIDSDNMTLDDCKAKCMLNCSCFAYAATNEDGTGCEIWISRAFFRETYHGRIIYILPSKGNKWWLWLTIAVGGMMVIPALSSFCYIIWTKCTSNGEENFSQRTLIKELEGRDAPSTSFGKPKGRKKDRNELHVFGFESIVSATNYFSTANKLGEGGFGPVYKGILFDGREVAIKRLSTSSGQGVTEFKNEALLIAKLQHTNLVRLLGFCIQGGEKILIYEYMPNKSLDSFLFDPARKKVLDWKIRLNIIEGIAQGLLYLHKYSRLRVIHRDLKASNILLDSEMNPKISDFGMARIFGLNEYEAKTNRVVGTYGYMSPEYAFHGLVSIKTDVFSFGVLLLELVSGKKNTGRYHTEHPLNLLGYTWQLCNEDRALEVMDPTLDGFCPHNQVQMHPYWPLVCARPCRG